jgi:hypothetical protein
VNLFNSVTPVAYGGSSSSSLIMVSSISCVPILPFSSSSGLL